MKKGIRAIRDEARHPGRAPPYKAADSAFERPPAADPAPAEEPPPPRSADTTGTTNLRKGEVPWYLADGDDVDGWDQVDGGPAGDDAEE